MSTEFINKRWTDFRVAVAARSGGSSPTLANFNATGIYDWQFTSNVDELHFSAQMPHGWDRNTLLYPHIHWSNSAAWTSGQVTWQLDYVVGAPAGGVVWSPVQTLTVLGPTSGGAYTGLVSDFSAIDISNINGIDYRRVSALFKFRLKRPSNTMNAGNPFLGEFDLHYALDKNGTIGINTEP